MAEKKEEIDTKLSVNDFEQIILGSRFNYK